MQTEDGEPVLTEDGEPLIYPRILLIDEIDKSDIDLPNDLLHLFWVPPVLVGAQVGRGYMIRQSSIDCTMR